MNLFTVVYGCEFFFIFVGKNVDKWENVSKKVIHLTHQPQRHSLT